MGVLEGKRPDDERICRAISEGYDTPGALFHLFYPDESLYSGSPNYSHLCKRIRSLKRYNIIKPVQISGRRFRYELVPDDTIRNI